MKNKLFLFASLALMLTACSPRLRFTQVPVGLGAGIDQQNGERIYFTATSGRGDQIGYSGGPDFGGMMMGTYLTCASCHGPEGYGGIHQMHMQSMDAPDIRLSALNAMDDMQGKNRPYNFDDFKTEVVDGKDLNGESLEADMPRWKMSEADLQDLFAFIQGLP